VSDRIEAPSDIGPKPEAVATHWKGEIDIALRPEERWRKEAKRVLEIYQPDNRSAAKKADFNILFSNTQTLAPALYTNTPTPDVRRRFRDEDPTGKEVAEVLERALSFSLDHYDFDVAAKQAVQDYLLVGRGVTRVKYEPTFKMERARIPVESVTGEFGETFHNGLAEVEPGLIKRDDSGFPYIEGDDEEVKDDESVSCETICYDDFLMSPAKTWAQVRWIAFRHRMTRDELKKSGFKDYKNIVLDIEDETLGDDETKDAFKRAEVWEIWDKDRREVLFINKGAVEPLKVVDDPLNLERFFPIPKPLYSIKGVSMVPTPEYLVYENLAKELDEVTKRIAAITAMVKVRGVYDATQDEIATILAQPDGTLVPSTNFAMLLEKGGLEKAVQFIDITSLAQVLAQLYLNRDQIKQTIYEVTGVSDILRGTTDPRETLGAQSIKAQFGSLRLEDRQKDVARFVRDLMRIKAEIIAEQFSPKTLARMSGKQITDEMMALMSDDGPRGFRIDIETDSTIAIDQNAEQEAVTKLLSGLTEFLTASVPLVQAQALTPEAVKSLALMAVRRFRGAREVEDAINAIEGEGGEQGAEVQLQQAQAQLQQMQAQGQEMQAQLEEAQSGQAEAQKKLEIEQAKAQAKAKVDEFLAQAKASLDEQATMAKIEREDEMAALTMRLAALEANAKVEREDFKAEHDVSRRGTDQQDARQ